MRDDGVLPDLPSTGGSAALSADEEWALMRRHSTIGADLIARMRPIAHLAPAIRAEHERWDGRGYPLGLRGEAIPIGAGA